MNEDMNALKCAEPSAYARARILDRQTDRQTDTRTTTVTLAAHARRGLTNEQNSATMVTINLKFSMCRDIIANRNKTKVFVVNPCDSCNTDVNTPLNCV